jgi:hypothetical protein
MRQRDFWFFWIVVLAVDCGGRTALDSGATASGGTPAIGGAFHTGGIGGTGGTRDTGAAPGTGGAQATGRTSNGFETVSSTGGSYGCPQSAPTNLDACECNEMPCECNYHSYWWFESASCPSGTQCIIESGYGYTCVGGAWRMLGGGAGSGCRCEDPSVLYGTGGSAGTGMGGAPSSGSTSGSGGTLSDGSLSSNTAPRIDGSGGSYGCPTSEPYHPGTPCRCTAPPCECSYRYSWGSYTSAACGYIAACDMSVIYSYTCQGGVWQYDWGGGNSGCECDAKGGG